VITDPRPFIAAAISGISAQPIHHQVNADGTHRVLATDIASRAVEIGVAAAAAFDAWEAATAPKDSENEPKV